MPAIQAIQTIQAIQAIQLLGGQPTGHISKAMMRHMETRHIDLEDTESWKRSIPMSRWFLDDFMMVYLLLI